LGTAAALSTFDGSVFASFGFELAAGRVSDDRLPSFRVSSGLGGSPSLRPVFPCDFSVPAGFGISLRPLELLSRPLEFSLLDFELELVADDGSSVRLTFDEFLRSLFDFSPETTFAPLPESGFSADFRIGVTGSTGWPRLLEIGFTGLLTG
jgi:hypothetical protein